VVDGKEIKLGLFADDLTAFLLNDNSLLKFFELLEGFGKCSDLNDNKSWQVSNYVTWRFIC
jgi:hypothetical protein